MNNRDVMTGIIIGIFITLVSLAVVVLFAQRSDSQPISCMEPGMRDKVRSVLLEALDNALRTRVERLSEVRAADGQEQPTRFIKGSQGAVRNYVNVRTFVLGWNPPPCS